MKRVISLALLVLMVLASISFAACTGGGGAPPTGGTTAPPSNEGTTPPSGGDTTPPPSGGGGFTWNDMPVYPGADQGEKAGWVPPLIEAEGEYRKVEVRYYGTEDSVSKVTSFYKSKMPGHGWQEMAWVEAGEMRRTGNHSKNNKQDLALVMITFSPDTGGALIGLVRASE